MFPSSLSYKNELLSKESPLNKIVEQYEKSIIKDTTLEEAKELIKRDNSSTPKLQKQR